MYKVWWCPEIFLGRSGLVVMMIWHRNHAWTQSHHLMEAFLEAMLLYKHQLFYDTYIPQTHTHTHTHTHIYIYIYMIIHGCVSANVHFFITFFQSFNIYLYTYLSIYLSIWLEKVVSTNNFTFPVFNIFCSALIQFIRTVLTPLYII